jgi:toxin-antitoxin system PIN domain toxin
MRTRTTLFFPDLNVWLALSVAAHVHNAEAWKWLNLLTRDTNLIFSRYTQLGMLRLLTNQAAMGEQTLTLKQAWDVYERWLGDPRVQFYPEPRGVDAGFRKATAPFAKQHASKWIGDCYLLAYAREVDAQLVTFDRALLEVARRYGYSAVVPG